ncbi:hypothetical protein HNY73_014947 [Argiope bruennichi]|uniref:Uncharacterized protein n=1 Tax=Argiope bruennichi TaxID=94029 RepID=A0A8T0EV72_ARGBR|nr:hypothetical protein HNY73_014947 [Argiope bruennichi]
MASEDSNTALPYCGDSRVSCSVLAVIWKSILETAIQGFRLVMTFKCLNMIDIVQHSSCEGLNVWKASRFYSSFSGQLTL